MEEKKGLFKLGLVVNLRRNDKGDNCMSFLSTKIGREIKLSELNDFIESDDFSVEYIDEDGNIQNESEATALRFKLPWNDTKGKPVYGHFSRKDITSNFMGVFWGAETIGKSKKTLNLRKYGYIDSDSWGMLVSLCGTQVSESNISDFINSNIDYYNGAGYTQFNNGSDVNTETGKFVRFETTLKTKEGDIIVGWFTKDSTGKFRGISWGTKEDFKEALKLRERCLVGHLVFQSVEECNDFLENLKNKTIPEPWEYKRKNEGLFRFPILKSYLQFELDRLYYEKDRLCYPDRIIYSEDKKKVLYNTNLIDKFGHDLLIIGDLFTNADKEYIGKLEISPSKMLLRKYGFRTSTEPKTPKFFQDINEIIFHCEWEIDQDMAKYEHIIEDRIDRFPAKYKEHSTDDLGQKLDNAIEFAKRIAQRNYKFIVPMYYPPVQRIQLLMPIYLETSYTAHPDFALVLTPHTEEQLYTPETILGLDEVYQDARLIAKPEESWLNPEIIE